jgi:hypothetical protein
MPNNPTCKDSLQVHAARLREFVQNVPNMGPRTRASLLAGAEALEVVEELLPILQEMKCITRGGAGRIPVLITAALARLEGK